jgi:hypothetical protein
MGDKFVAQIRLGQQTCHPALNFSVTKMQEENIIAQLVFLKEIKFSFYFRNTSFFCLGKKNQLNSGDTENHTRPTNLSPSSDQGDKLVGLVTSGYVQKIGLNLLA